MFVSLDVRLAPSRLLLLLPKTARVMRVEARPINPMLPHAFNVVTLATLPRPCNLCSVRSTTGMLLLRGWAREPVTLMPLPSTLSWMSPASGCVGFGLSQETP